MQNYELPNTNYKFRTVKFLCAVCFILCGFAFRAAAQSTNQNFPTPISTNEISGKINARDVGDARLTTYFFVFNGTQGDIFVNLKTANFDGDIDVFAAENLRPLTKITVFSDVPETETGRVLYLRKPEKMILRIQGRSPNDAAATFNLKFAGSFAPAAALAENEIDAEQPQVKTENQSDVQVNSVGTIIAVKPKPAPTPKEIVAENQLPPVKIKTNKTRKTPKKTGDAKAKNPEEKTGAEKTDAEKVAENSPPTEPEKTPDAPALEPAAVTDKTSENETSAAPKAAKKPRRKPAPVKKSTAPNALENVRLLILLKDGTKIERAMSEVLRVGVDKSGVLTLITKDGKISRYSISDVAKMTIE